MDHLCVVNRYEPLDDKYIPSELVFDPLARIWLEKETYKAFYAMTRQMQNEGISIPFIKAGYRSYAHQNKLYHIHLKEKHYRRYSKLPNVTLREVVPGGCSEHQLGMCIDFDESEVQVLWLMRHSQEFGFIRRYLEGKENKTLRSASLTHYRYVGVNHAKKIAKCGLCLEEYVEIYRQNNGSHILRRKS